jgi:hypothetical protein
MGSHIMLYLLLVRTGRLTLRFHILRDLQWMGECGRSSDSGTDLRSIF